MAFELKFTTRSDNYGKSMIIVDKSTDWSEYSSIATKVVIKISVVNDHIPLYNEYGSQATEITKIIDKAPSEGFEYEITSSDLGYSASRTIPDCIYSITLQFVDSITTTTETTSDTSRLFISLGRNHTTGPPYPEYEIIYDYDTMNIEDLQNIINVNPRVLDQGFENIAFFNNGNSIATAFETGISTMNVYNLENPYDISNNNEMSVYSYFILNVDVADTDYDDIISAMKFKNDGSRVFIAINKASGGSFINQYDIVASVNQHKALSSQVILNVSTEVGADVSGISFNESGDTMYLSGQDSAAIYQYSLSTPFNISTASYVQFYDVSATLAIAYGIHIGYDGLKMFTSDDFYMYEFDLSTAYDISTASYNGIRLLINESGVSRLTSFNFEHDSTTTSVSTTVTTDVLSESTINDLSWYNSENLKNNKFISTIALCPMDTNIELVEEPLFLTSQLNSLLASAIYGDTTVIYNILDNLNRKYPKYTIY